MRVEEDGDDDDDDDDEGEAVSAVFCFFLVDKEVDRVSMMPCNSNSAADQFTTSSSVTNVELVGVEDDEEDEDKEDEEEEEEEVEASRRRSSAPFSFSRIISRAHCRE